MDGLDLQTVAVMVNSACNLRCTHCDLPRRYDRYRNALAPEQWTELVARLARQLNARVVSVSAMEPLLPKIGQPRTAAVLRAAKSAGSAAGLVTNGYYAQQFLDGQGRDLTFDFFDISIDGGERINDTIRGPGHFSIVDRFLSANARNYRLGRLALSFTLTSLSANPDELDPFLDWVLRSLREPRLVVLLLYPNQHVAPNLALTDDLFLSALDVLVRRSSEFAEIFLDVFPSSLPGLAKLVGQGVLPGAGQVARDPTGLYWGHIDEGLFIRYETRRDLIRTTLRISPEGLALLPEGFERHDYQSGAVGSLVDEDLPVVLDRLSSRLDQAVSRRPHPLCRNRPCQLVCNSENHRCAVLAPGSPPQPPEARADRT